MAILKASTPGRSEMSHGPGLFAEPRTDFQSWRDLPWSTGEDKRDLQMLYQAQKRTDPTNGQELFLPNMLYELGNPDQFGPAPAMVQTKVQYPKALPQVVAHVFGVTRQG